MYFYLHNPAMGLFPFKPPPMGHRVGWGASKTRKHPHLNGLAIKEKGREISAFRQHITVHVLLRVSATVAHRYGSDACKAGALTN